MEKAEAYFQESYRMTRFAEALSKEIEGSGELLLSDYEMFLLSCDVYRKREAKYLRGDYPSVEQYKRSRRILKEAGAIALDDDYHRLWRVMSHGKISADEAVCSADPLCYVSHISAMQRYGLTLRRPEALHITRPSSVPAREMLVARMQRDVERFTFEGQLIEYPKLTKTNHPSVVRGRKVVVKTTSRIGEMRAVRGSKVRVASIGQVFLDTLSDPEACGGMAHVLEVWEEKASIYLEEIVQRVDAEGTDLAKVRAGYIIDERMKLGHKKLNDWAVLAQRGGSRVLDPSKPYYHTYSEKWMISLNVD